MSLKPGTIAATILLLLFSFNYSPEKSFGISASEIIKKSEAALRGNTQVALYEITIKTRRWTRTLKMRSWENRLQKRSFSEIISPKKDAGNRFLLVKNTMKHFIPKLQKVIKISPSMMLQSWMGSDFTNDDIVKESSIHEDYYHKIIGSKSVDGNPCHIVELKPKPDAAVVWGKIIYYAREKDYLPVREEFYNEHNVLKKVLTCYDFKKMHDRIIPTTYKMVTVKKKNRYTLMKIKRTRFNTRIPSRVFTLQNLKGR
jgi:outer membrane lipoprotein-sorting protein